MEVSKAILALISIAINQRARVAKLEELNAELSAKVADLTAKVAAGGAQTVDVPADVADALTAAASQA